MATAQQRSRHQQRIEELTAAGLRGLTGDASLHFEGGRLFRGDERVPIRAPHLKIHSSTDPLSTSRGIADALALRTQLSDADLHARLQPADKLQAMLFDWLEQLRVEALVPATWKGMRANLQRRFEHWSAQYLDSGLTETSLGILLFSFSQICWSRLMSEALPEHIQDLLEPTRAGLAPAIGTALAGLRAQRYDQEEYAVHALAIITEITQRIEAEYEDSPETVSTQFSRFTLAIDDDTDAGDEFSVAGVGESKSFALMGGSYRIFTTAFDKQHPAADLVRPALLADYRKTLDQRIARQGLNIGRLIRAYRALLTRPQTDGWLFGMEDGVIDGRRLSQLVSSNSERRVFRQDRVVPHSPCIVTLLLDCSGSMKQYNQELALFADLLVRLLGQAGVASEVLGFTTNTWNGGRPMKQWQSRGKPPLPGRLNETCHLVFKDADTSWRHARASLPALMKTDLFREGVDGEAVQWACERMLVSGYQRRILIVVSDGCPMDSATNLANDAFYLDNHLRSVVRKYSSASAGVEIVGMGVGLDMSPYYPRSFIADLTEGLQNNVFDDLLATLAGRHRR